MDRDAEFGWWCLCCHDFCQFLLKKSFPEYQVLFENIEANVQKILRAKFDRGFCSFLGNAAFLRPQFHNFIVAGGFVIGQRRGNLLLLVLC
jgi:hypothetical protein